MNDRLCSVFWVAVGGFKEIFKRITIIMHDVKHCVSMRKNVVEDHLNNFVIKVLDLYLFGEELLNQTPMEETETHVSFERPIAVVNSIVQGEDLLIHVIFRIHVLLHVIA